MPQGQPDPGAAGIRVGMRGPLPGEVGQEEEAFRSGRGCGRLRAHQFIGIDLHAAGHGGFGMGQLIAIPLQAAAR